MSLNTVRGHLTAPGTQRVVGWAIGEGSEPVWVDILVNGELRARICADRPRRDLVRRKLHNQLRCGFEWAPPSDAPLREGDVISARMADGGLELPNSPQTVAPPSPRAMGIAVAPVAADERGAAGSVDDAASAAEASLPAAAEPATLRRRQRRHRHVVPARPSTARNTPAPAAADERGAAHGAGAGDAASATPPSLPAAAEPAALRRRQRPALPVAPALPAVEHATSPPAADAGGAPPASVGTTEPGPQQPQVAASAADTPAAPRRRSRRRRGKPALPLTELAPTLLTDRTQARIASEEDVARLPQMPLLPPASKRNSWQIFQHSLWAFFLRDLRSRYSEYRLGYFWAIVQPLAYLVLIRQVRHLIGGGQARDPYDVSFTWFLALGIIPFFMFQHSFHRCLGAMSSFKGMYAYRQLKPIDVVLARVAIEALTMAALFIMLWIGFWWLDLSFDAEDPLEFLAAIGLLLLFGLGVGLLADVYVTRDRELRQVFQLAERPLLFISGIFFVIDDLPEGAKPYLLWNPLLHAIDLARGAMLSHYDSPGSWTYLIGSTIVVLLLGLAAYRRNLNALTQ